MGMFLRRGPAPHRTRMSDLEIGHTIKLNVNGTPWDWLVVHHGLPSSIYDASCDGTWLLMKDVYEKRQWNSTDSNVLETSTIQSYLNGDFLNLFDGKVKRAIKQVKIPYRKNVGSGGTDQSGANGLPCKIFLLSSPEAHIYSRNDGEGASLSYFASTSPTSTDSKRIANYNGSPSAWWLRSPTITTSTNVWNVRVDGSSGNANTSYTRGIRPALILPSDFIVTDDMLTA